jgi:sugar phosphate isomerase/epimerase
MLRFSCADFAFPLLSRQQSFQLLRLLGFCYVDLGLFARNKRLSPSELSASPIAFTNQLKEELKKANLQVADLFLQIGMHPADHAVNDASALVRAESRDVFLHSLDLCAALDCRHLTGLPGVFHEATDPQQDLDLTAEELTWRTRACAQANIQYAIEPHLGSICQDVTSTLSLLHAADPLSLTLDYGHFICNGHNSEEVHALLPLASHIHARGGARGRLQTSVAENEIDFTGIINRLRNLQYNGFIALEYVWDEWQACNRTDNISETILLRSALEAFDGASSN